MLPNLFYFATSELSQDAVLCWLLSWADMKHKESHPHLHDVAKDLISLIYRRAKVEVPIDFSSIDIRKQDGGIDVLCIINKAGPTHDRYLHKLIKSRSVEWLQARF